MDEGIAIGDDSSLLNLPDQTQIELPAANDGV
jgi:hypothetical protein